MGWHMAGRLQGHFAPVIVHAKSSETVAGHVSSFNTQKLAAWTDLADVDYVFMCLPTSTEVLSVVTEAERYLRPGTLIVDCTSGDPDVTAALGKRLSQRGIDLVDAPLSGGPSGAQAGKLSVMVGGDDILVERCRPLFAPLASTVEHVGDLSAGHAIKAVNNALATIAMLAAGEGLATLRRRGVDVKRALAAINASSGRSWMTEELLPKRVLSRTFDHGFALKLMHKDVRIACSMADSGEPQQSTPLLHEAERSMAAAVETFGPNGDLSEALKAYEDQSRGLRIE